MCSVCLWGPIDEDKPLAEPEPVTANTDMSLPMFSKRNAIINGYGRIGRLTMRAIFEHSEINIIGINEIAGDVATAAYLTEFDTHHGRWMQDKVSHEGSHVIIDGRKVAFTQYKTPAEIPLAEMGVTIVIECTGKFNSAAKLQPYFDNGAKKVVVSAPLKDKGVPNIVVGVNDDTYDPKQHSIVTAASCTTNCIAPVMKLLHDKVGIKHGSITTIHCLTNTQSVLDAAWCAEKEPRRARGSVNNYYPTTTGSAKAVVEVIPELKGKLNGHAVRVPLATSSMTDITLEMVREVTREEINGIFAEAAKGSLRGILGIEGKLLTAADFCHDARSTIIDEASTLVVGGTQVKTYAWYDNEWGYSNRLAELARRVAKTM